MSKLTDRYVDFVERKRKLVLGITSFFMVGFTVFIFNLTVDLSTEAFLFPNDPLLKQYAQFQDRFGNDDMILLAVTGDVFSNEFLEKIDSLQKELATHVPYAKDVTSIINISQLYVEKDLESGLSTLYVDDLLKNFPEEKLSQKELQELKNEVLADPGYRNQIISEDGNTTTIFVQLYSNKEIDEQETKDENAQEDGVDTDDFANLEDLFEDDVTPQEEVFDTELDMEGTEDKDYISTYLSNTRSRDVNAMATSIAKKYDTPDFDVALVGHALLIPSLINALLKDAVIFLPMLLLMIVIFIKIMFKRKSAILFTMLVAGLTNISFFGLLSLSNTPITLMSNITPIMLISIGLGAVVHLLVLVYEKFDEGYTKIDALKYAFDHSGWPIILTTLTSAAGIFSFYFSSIKPMQDFGILGAVGLLISLVLTLLVIPCLLLTLPIKPLPIQKRKISLLIDKMLLAHANTAYRIRILTLVLSVGIIFVAFLGVKNVYFSHKSIEWLPLKSEFRKDSKIVDKVMKGSNFLEIYIDTKKHNGVYEPSFLNKAEKLEQYLYAYKNDYISVGKVLSLNEMIKKTNKVLHNNDETYYTIPDTRELVAQELLLLENGGTDTLENFVDLNYQHYRLTVTVPDLDAVFFSEFLRDVETKMHEIFKDDDYTYYTTGSVALIVKIIEATILSARTSYIIAFIVIGILMILLTKNISIGLISMIPNILPIFILLGIVGFSTINLDMFVLLIGCVLLGIAVDNTIHFIHVYGDYYRQGNSDIKSIELTFLSTGKAMISASIILMAGFSVLIFARMRNFHNFGMLAVIGVVCALFSDFFLTPALMVYVTKFGLFEKKKKKK